jgi:hypothetical protein
MTDYCLYPNLYSHAPLAHRKRSVRTFLFSTQSKLRSSTVYGEYVLLICVSTTHPRLYKFFLIVLRKALHYCLYSYQIAIRMPTPPSLDTEVSDLNASGEATIVT